jgi:hypothetical protein
MTAKGKPKKKRSAASDYGKVKEDARVRSMERSMAGRDCAEWVHAPVDALRREACKNNFRLFCETYEPERYDLAWSDAHIEAIATIERVVLNGGRHAIALPRGSGKTTLSVSAVKWAALYGHCRYVALIGATDGHAETMLDGIKTDLESNELYEQDFSDVCGPIRALEGISHRAKGQLCNGTRTRIVWRSDKIIFPTVEGGSASGTIVSVAGILGRVRGMQHTMQDGTIVRPSLVILDDPQTDDSAKSRVQCDRRERVLSRAILNLAGPKQKIAGIMPCTVICPGDMVDRMLDQEKHPEWNVTRVKMMEQEPTNEKLWRQYADIREESLRVNKSLKQATKFYREHQKEMDAGAKIMWPEWYDDDEASAIQHAMNLKLTNEPMFMAEFQHAPVAEDLGDVEQLDEDAFCQRLNGVAHGVVPLERTVITAYCDVQKDALPYVVCAWGEEFSGDVIDYGVFPEQSRKLRNFRLRDAHPTIAQAHEKQTGNTAGLEGNLYWAMGQVAKKILGRKWSTASGTELAASLLLFDAQWGESTDVVYQFCRETEYHRSVMPAHGTGITASMRPMSERKRKKGEKIGLNWYIPVPGSRRVIRHVNIDANFWKTFVNHRLLTQQGDPGSLALYGRDPSEHVGLAAHYLAERPDLIHNETRQRTVTQWTIRERNLDNHWWDGLVGCAVGASMLGIAVKESGGSSRNVMKPTPRKKIKLSELQKAKERAGQLPINGKQGRG